MYFRVHYFRLVCFALISSMTQIAGIQAQEKSSPIRVGIIGLDTSHAPAFAKLFNSPDAKGEMQYQQVTHAFPGGSDDIQSSYSRLPGYTEELNKMGIVIVPTIDELLKNVDAVLLHSLDGRKHLAQVIPVFKAKKPVFIDKPLAGTLAEAIAIHKLGKKYGARWFTSSSLRYSAEMIRYRESDEKRSTVRGAISWGPCSLEQTHPDLFWYGVHGVETLYTAMGPGCESVVRLSTENTDIAIGTWSNGMIGEFRGIRKYAAPYGLVVFGEKAVEIGGKFDGYAPLAERVALFFRGTYEGVSNEESIEMFTFMEAADESKRQGGKPVSLRDVRTKAEQVADAMVKDL